MPCPAPRHRPPARLTECLRQVHLLTARHALELDVGRSRAADLVQPDLRLAAARLLVVAELDPRELVEVAVLAGRDEPGRHRERRPAVAPAVVHEAGPIRPIRFVLQIEQPAVDRNQQVAARCTASSVGTARRSRRRAPSRRTGCASPRATAPSAAPRPAPCSASAARRRAGGARPASAGAPYPSRRGRRRRR